MKAPVFSAAPTVSAAIREHRGRFIVAPFDADGWQTEPSQDYGPVDQSVGDLLAIVRCMFDVSEVVMAR